MSESPNRRAETDALISQASDEVKERQRRLAERESIDATASPPRRRLTLAALIVAVPTFIAILVFSFTTLSLSSLFVSPPPPLQARQEAKKALDELVVQVEAFRHDFNELPEGLIEIGIPSNGDWRYTVVAPDHYTVQGTLYGQRVSFDSKAKQAGEDQ